MKLTGGCHCGAVRFSVDAETPLTLLDCNCSICTKTGYLHLIAPRQAFRLLSGADAQTEYRFGTKAARHFFCAACGVKSVYVPRSHPDSYSVNAVCLDGWPEIDHGRVPFDGRNWDAAKNALLP